jgi:DNA repair exonuclease SbcCD nuclease subunit
MKIAVLTDTHTGVKNGNDIFLDYTERFYSELFFPYCLKHGIKKIIHLGDYFDHRKYLNYKVLSRNKEMFLDKLEEYDMTMDIIPGNHDTFFRNTNSLCSLTECLQHQSSRVDVIMSPTVREYGGMRIALLPWITVENYAESVAFIEKANAPIIGAHLELEGFEMMKGAPAVSHGMSAGLFSRYEMVLSGHYHTKSSRDNIHYLGVPYEITWADCNDPKYFHVLDATTRELIEVRNPITLFNRLVYDDSVQVPQPIVGTELTGTYVKVVVTSKKDPYAFDKYIDSINAADPFDLKIVESFVEYSADNIDDESIEVSDTPSLLNSYVNAIETDLDKERIKRKLQELYVESQLTDNI